MEVIEILPTLVQRDWKGLLNVLLDKYSSILGTLLLNHGYLILSIYLSNKIIRKTPKFCGTIPLTIG
jgi:hypothetical protein